MDLGIKEIIMKKIIVILVLLSMVTPVFAMTTAEKAQKQQEEYQLKIEKIKQKQELKNLKNQSKNTVEPAKQQQFTLGLVQKEIKIGTSQDEVALALGSPNIVTKDSDGKDTWIYDKVATIASYSNSGFSLGAAGAGGGGGSYGGGLGLLGIAYGKNRGNTQTNQKTLTVVIKFNKQNQVESFTYHMSNF